MCSCLMPEEKTEEEIEDDRLQAIADKKNNFDPLCRSVLLKQSMYITAKKDSDDEDDENEEDS